MFALVDANSFYASAEQVFDPDAARRPVVVLSNNDGVVVAASKDANALGLEMFKPYFQIKHKLRGHDVKVFSSNYTLYDDMSRRLVSIYRQHANQIEIYSIDECFVAVDKQDDHHLLHWGSQLRQQAMQWTGIGVGVGIAASKTLAKLANHLAKRDPIPAHPDGVCILTSPHAIDRALGRIQLRDLWGVARGTIKRLASLNITTPHQLRDADPNRIRKHLGVVGQRLVFELRGDPCIHLEEVVHNRKNVCVSRSFNKTITSITPLREAIVTFASQAGVKLRRQDLAARALTVFIQTDQHAPLHVEQYNNAAMQRFTVAAFDTRELAAAAVHCLDRIYRAQHGYKRAGVMLLDLQKRVHTQPGLFDTTDRQASHRLMAVLDRVNRDHGAGTLRLASASPFQLRPCRTWHLRSDHCSPRYTTRWDELPIAQAIKEEHCDIPCKQISKNI